jgi:hypothetical protein
MPVTINGAPLRAPKVSPRSQPYNAAVRKLAPLISEIRVEGHVATHEIMNALNDRGVAAAGGGRFTYGTTYRVLVRLEQLGLGPGPRTVSAAVSARPYTPRLGSSRSAARALTQIVRKHPELLVGLHEPGSTRKPEGS